MGFSTSTTTTSSSGTVTLSRMPYCAGVPHGYYIMIIMLVRLPALSGRGRGGGGGEEEEKKEKNREREGGGEGDGILMFLTSR